MARPLRVALGQFNAVVGDVGGNEERIAGLIETARQEGAQIVAFPELAITGYPPEDLLLKEHFLADARAAVERLAAVAEGIVVVVGFPERATDVYNAAAVLAEGRLAGIYRKQSLPNHGVFDEVRHFQSGTRPAVVEVDGVIVGLTVCEDIWQPGPPMTEETLAGATVVLNLSASPFQAGKAVEREQMIAQRAKDNVACVAFCGMVGGQDELVFDGHSVVVDHEGVVLARAPQFAEHLLVATIDPTATRAARLRDTRRRPAARGVESQVDHLGAFSVLGHDEAPTPGPAGEVVDLLDDEAEVYAALITGLRDYVHKNGFDHVVLGLSGGVDSTLVALVAVDALGADRVTCVIMPSPHSSPGSQADARALAANLGVQVLELRIEDLMAGYDALLADVFADVEPDITEENLQARIRGNLLMALSNKFGWLVVTTGNKSEVSVGYSTLYGDSAGGFAVIKDVPKLMVYRLVDERASRDPRSPVPPEIVTRAPSAELRPDQRDDDALPPYEILDAILEGYVEDDLGREQLVARGLEAQDVDRVIGLVDGAEYKRRQQPPGPRVTSKAFGRDRRVPITNRYGG